MLLAGIRKSVLIVSTDPAHNLSDAFGQKFSGKPTKVNGFDNLSCMEIEPSQVLAEANADEMDVALEGTAAGAGLNSFIKEIGSTIPGTDEALSFAEIMKSVDSMDFEVVVFDTAPTGHTLRLLSFPRALESAFDKFAPMRDTALGMASRFGPMMGMSQQHIDGLLARLDSMRATVERVNQQFKDPSRTTFVCVCIPEFLSLYETGALVGRW